MSTETNTPDVMTLAEASRRLGYHAKAVSDAVYRGRVSVADWPVIAGRRLVPASALETIRQALATDRRRTRQRARVMSGAALESSTL